MNKRKNQSNEKHPKGQEKISPESF
jgi:hypothetical protein